MAQPPRKFNRPRYLPQKSTPPVGGQAGRSLPGIELDEPRVEEMAGFVEKVIFHNEENGYTVLSLVPKGKLDSIVVVGHMLMPEEGGSVRISGQWTSHPRFGPQFSMQTYEVERPSSLEGIAAFLSSGMVKGVGKVTARRIVDKFKEDTVRILDEEPLRLCELSRINYDLAERIHQAWTAQHGIRDLIVFLEPSGISTAYAVRIYKHYGPESLEVLKENPYRLAMDIRGIGFLTADMLAGKLGFAKEHPLRAEAGVLYTLRRLMEDGHMCYPRHELINITVEDLDVPEVEADAAIDRLIAEERFVQEFFPGPDSRKAEEPDEAGLLPDWEDLPDVDINADLQGEGGEPQPASSLPFIYLANFYHFETAIAHYLGRIMASPKSVEIDNAETIIAEVLAALPIKLAPQQAKAVEASVRDKVMVITGGPGTGKTTIINAIIKVFAQRTSRILLAAPTGRAAKRLAETSGRDARTVHRLLEYNPSEDGFARNENNPLACGLLIIDEVSMMDTMLMHFLLKAVPLGCTVLLVGDVNQLPSVGPGNVLKDIIDSGVVPMVELNEIFRQAEASEIILNAHRINKGQLPELGRPPDGELSDFYFINIEDPEQAAHMVVNLVAEHIPRRFGFDPLLDVQVLSPMHKGTAGAANLNVLLQAALNRETAYVQRGERRFLLGDKVMQTRNNYEKDVYNGDIGCICYLNTEERELTVRFDDRNVLYAFDELDEIMPAYAISVHKSQGSEYRAVVLPVLTQHYVLLQRNLLYTAVTRGRDLVIIVGTAKAVAMAVKNNRTQRRYTWLAWRLEKALGGSRVLAPVARHSFSLLE